MGMHVQNYKMKSLKIESQETPTYMKWVKEALFFKQPNMQEKKLRDNGVTETKTGENSKG